MSKIPISLRLDPEVLAWFKQFRPKGYQSEINAVLSEHVRQQTEATYRKAGRAQELFRQFYPQCFWHYAPDLVITPENFSLVIEGLRRFGGRRGYLLSEELCR